MNLQGKAISIILLIAILVIIVVLLITANQNIDYNPSSLNKNDSEGAIDAEEDVEKNDSSTENSVKNAVDEGKDQGDLESRQNDQEVVSHSPRDREMAIEYNSQGYDLYLGGQYEEALELFEKAISFDDSYFYGHYNYACTLGVLMKQDYETWFGYKQEIIKSLWKVQELNPEYIQRIKTDPDLDLIRKEFDYYLLLGLSPTKTEDAKEILSNLTWYIQGQGAYSILGGAELKSDNTFILWYYDFSNAFEILEFKGTYEVEDNRLTLYLDNRMLRKRDIADIFDNYSEYEEEIIIYGELTEDGEIEIDIFQYPLTYWYDEFSA